jgi:hypothetical protein
VHPNKFAELDSALVPSALLPEVRMTRSHRLVTADVDPDVPKIKPRPARGHCDTTAPRQPSITQTFQQRFLEVTEMQAETRNNHLQSGIDKQPADITAALHAAVSAAIPLRNISATRPWISAATLHAIQTRNMARNQGQWMLERSMHRPIKKSAQRDRRRWLNAMIDTGDPGEIYKS